jgi:hypothetical protein
MKPMLLALLKSRFTKPALIAAALAGLAAVVNSLFPELASLLPGLGQ